MKTIYLKLVLPVAVMGLLGTACKKKNTPVDENGKPEKVGNLTSHTGKTRIKLGWTLPGNADIQKCRVYWNAEKESKEAAVTPGKNQMEVIISNLEEGMYDFTVYAYNSKGNVSDKMTVKGKVLGETYEEGLNNRGIKSSTFNETEGTVAISWNSAATDVIGTEIKYTNAANVAQTVTVTPFASVTNLTDFKKAGVFEYRTLYKPIGAIDTFYTAYEPVEANPAQPGGGTVADAPLGSGWVEYSPLRKIHLDDAAGLQIFNWTAYKSVGSPICADYNYQSATGDETFRILTTQSNRSEIRIHDDYSTGSRQFQGYLTFYSPLNDESVMQIFGSVEGATQMMIRGYAASGGSLRGLGQTLVTDIYNTEVRVNVIHLQEDKGAKIIIYINGLKKAELVDNEAVTNYMKYGNYGTMKTGQAVVKWRNAKVFRNGTAPL